MAIYRVNEKGLVKCPQCGEIEFDRHVKGLQTETFGIFLFTSEVISSNLDYEPELPECYCSNCGFETTDYVIEEAVENLSNQTTALKFNKQLTQSQLIELLPTLFYDSEEE